MCNKTVSFSDAPMDINKVYHIQHTKWQVLNDQRNRVENDEEVSRISLFINGLNKAQHKITAYQLYSYIDTKNETNSEQ